MTIQQRPDNFTIDSRSSFADKLIFAGLGNYAGSDLYKNSAPYNKNGVLTTLTPSTAWKYDYYLKRQTINFTSSGHRINLPNFTSFGCTTFSISMWLNQRSGSTTGTFYCLDSETGRIIVGTNTNAGVGVFAAYIGAGWYYFGNRPGLNVWMPVTYIINGTTASCYYNGIQSGSDQTVPSISLGGTTNVGSRYFYISSWYTFTGQISDILIHNRVLSNAEIKEYADRSNLLLSGLIVPPKRKVFNVGFQSSDVAAGTLQKLNIVRDCWWLMPSGTSYLIDETQSFSTYSHGLYKSLGSTDDSTYIQFCGSGTPEGNGTSYYFGRLESTNIAPDRLHVGIRASGIQTGSSATISINNMEMGSFGSWSDISLQSGVFDLTTTQKERILDGRIGDNYDFVGVKLSNSGILDKVKLYNVEVYYSGASWDNHTTGLPNVLSTYLYPTKLGFRGNSTWINQVGGDVDYSGYYHINIAPSSVDADIYYIQQSSPPNSSIYWGDGNPGLSGGLSLYFNPSGVDSLTQITRAQMTLRMSLPPSGLYENARDTFEINGYNYRFKDGDYKEDIPNSVGSIKFRDRKYGYFVYGAGSTVEQSGFKDYTTELNFLDPNLPSGDIDSVKYRNIDIFNNMEFQIVGLPSGVQLSAAELYVEYLPNDVLGLYTTGKVYRSSSFVYPDTSGSINIFNGNGKWHHRGNINETQDVFTAFYKFSETSGTKTYPIVDPDTTSDPLSMYGEYKDVLTGTIEEPVRYEYYRNPIVDSGVFGSPTYYRNMIYNGNIDSNNINIEFENRINIGFTHTLYFMLYRKSSLSTYGAFFVCGLDDGSNCCILGWMGNDTVRFYIKSATLGSFFTIETDINQFAKEPILVWFTSEYDDSLDQTTCHLYTHSNIDNYFGYDWQHDSITFTGYIQQYIGEKIVLGSFSTSYIPHNIGIIEFGYNTKGYDDSAINLNYLTSTSEVQTNYDVSTDLDKKFFASRICNASYLQGSGINWIVPNGSGKAEFATQYFIDDWADLNQKHSIYNPITTAGTNHVVHPSAIYLELITENSTDHPSGTYIDIDIEFDSGSTDNWKVAHFELNIPSGTETTYIKTIDSHIGMDAEPIRLSDVSSIIAKLNTQYVDVGSTQYNGNLSIKSLRVYFDSYCVAATGLGDLDLYTYGSASTANNNIDLFLEGCVSSNKSVDLYVYGIGHPASGDIVPLYINADHYAYPSELGNNYKTLYINGLTPHYSSGNIPLYSWATASGVGGSSYSAPMYIFGLSRDDWIPLYITTPVGTLTAEKTLYIKGLVGESNLTLNLYTVGPSGANSDTTYLYIKGLGTTDGAIPYNANIPLYMSRSSEAIDARMNLYMAQHTTTNNINMFVEGMTTHNTFGGSLNRTGARDFSNTFGYFQTTTFFNGTLRNKFFVDGWLRINSNSSSFRIIDMTNTSARGFIISCDINKYLSFYMKDYADHSTTITSSGNKVNTDDWSYFNINVDWTGSSGVMLYINNGLVGSGSISMMSSYIPDNTLEIGSSYNGQLARIGVGSGILLNDTDRIERYNNGRGILYSEMSSSLKSKYYHLYDLNEQDGASELSEEIYGDNASMKDDTSISTYPGPNHGDPFNLYISGSGAWPTSQIKLYTHGY